MMCDDELAIWNTKAHLVDTQHVDNWWKMFTQRPGMNRAWGDHWSVSKYHQVFLAKMSFDPETYQDIEHVKWLAENCDPSEYSLVIAYTSAYGYVRIAHMNNIRGTEPQVAGVFFKNDSTLALFKLAFTELLREHP